MTRQATNKLLEAIENGLLDRDTVIMACVKYMSEDEVADMCHHNEFFPEEEFEINDEDELRDAFFEENPEFERDECKSHNDYPTDTRCAYVDFVDCLQKAGRISEELANTATL